MFWTRFRIYTLVPAFIIVILLSYFLSKKLRDKDEQTKLIPIKIISIVLLVLELCKQVLSIIRGYDLYHIPLHFCSLFLYFLPIAAFYKGKYKEYFRTLAAVVSACLYLFMCVYPLLIYSDEAIMDIKNFFTGNVSSFFQLHAVLFHNIALLPFLFFAFEDICKHDTKRDIKIIIIGFAIYSVVSATIGNIFDINFNNFVHSNAPFLENLRLSLVDKLHTLGQIVYVIIVAIGTIIVPILAYLFLKLFEKLFVDIKVGIKTTIVTTALVALGLIITIFNKGIGMVVCSVVTMIAVSAGIPTLLNVIKEKNKKYMLIDIALLVVCVLSIVLQGIML